MIHIILFSIWIIEMEKTGLKKMTSEDERTFEKEEEEEFQQPLYKKKCRSESYRTDN